MKLYSLLQIYLRYPLMGQAGHRCLLILVGLAGLVGCGTDQKLVLNGSAKNKTSSNSEEMQAESYETDSKPYSSSKSPQDGNGQNDTNPTITPTTAPQNRLQNLKATFEPASVSLELQWNCGGCHQSFYALPGVLTKKNQILERLWVKKMPPANGNYGLSAEALPLVKYLVCVAKAQNPGFKVKCP